MTGVEPRPETYLPLGIADGIRSSTGRTPGKVALAEGERSLTYSDLLARIERVAHGTRHGLGLEAGQHVAVMAPNCLEYIELICGTASAGVPAAMINARSSAREAQVICDDAEARVLFVHPSVEDLRDLDLASVERIIVLGGEYERWLAEAKTGRPEPAPEEWSTFCIPYTSGTTGEPKGVLLPHRARALVFFAMAVEFGCFGSDDRALAFAPLYHGAGFAFAAAPVFFGGFCEILSRFEPEIVLRRLVDGGMTNVFMVPSHFHGLFAPGVGVRERPAHLRAIISNAAPLAQATKEQIVASFGEGLLHECYGATEAGITSNLRPADQLRKERCVGLPFPCTEVRLLDEDGQDVPDGEVGELYSRSPWMFGGYWKRPDATRAAMRGPWFSPGDLARRDDEGYLYIVDRKSDRIISGGVNIYPGEVEDVVARHPAVQEVAVFGVPDERWGEAVQAAVVLRPGEPATVAEILAACGELGRYKLPKRIEFVDALPRNTVGKVLRRALRESHRPAVSGPS